MSNRRSNSLAVSRSDALASSRDGARNRKRTRNGLRQLTPVDLGLPELTSERVFQNEPTEPCDRTRLDKTGQNRTRASKVRNRTHRSPGLPLAASQRSAAQTSANPRAAKQSQSKPFQPSAERAWRS